MKHIMEKRKGLLLLLALFPLFALAKVADSAQYTIDSLRRELEELRLKEIVMKQALDSTGESARIDSIQRECRRQHIDSIRLITPGVPVVIEGDTLFTVYASLGGESPSQRVEDIKRTIIQIGKSFRTTTDSVHVFESDFTSDLMCGEISIMHVSDMDAIWNVKKRQDLAHEYQHIIDDKIRQLHDTYGLQAKLRGIAWAIVLIVVQILFFILTSRFIRWIRKEIIGGIRGRLHALVIKDY